jgi:hypothetical protein
MGPPDGGIPVARFAPPAPQESWGVRFAKEANLVYSKLSRLSSTFGGEPPRIGASWVPGTEEGQMSVTFGCRFRDINIPVRLHYWKSFQLEFQAELSVLTDTVTFKDRSLKRLGREIDLDTAYNMRKLPNYRAIEESERLLLSNKEFETLAKASTADRIVRPAPPAPMVQAPLGRNARREQQYAARASIVEVPPFATEPVVGESTFVVDRRTMNWSDEEDDSLPPLPEWVVDSASGTEPGWKPQSSVPKRESPGTNVPPRPSGSKAASAIPPRTTAPSQG